MIEIARMRRACEKALFCRRCFTEREWEQAKGRAESLAGYFAAKEAMAKALGTGFRQFDLHAIEVEKDELGKPSIRLHGQAKRMAEEKKIAHIHLSISHEREVAVAFVVAEN